MPFLEDFRNPFWKLEENVEMVTRGMVHDGFADLIGTKVSSRDLEAFERVFFDVVYPTNF